MTGSVAAASRTDTSWPYAYPCRPGETGSAAAPKGREQNRPRAARRIALDEADRIARVYLEAMDAVGSSGDRDHAAGIRAASAFLAEAFGRPALAFSDETNQPTKSFTRPRGTG